jgi:hypothetical protein
MGYAKRDINSYSEKRQHFRKIFFQNFLPLMAQKIKSFHVTLLLALIAISSFYVIPAKANGTCYVVVGTVLTDGTACSGTVNIDNNVTSIGTNAFSTLGIESVTIPSSVTSIAASAFENARNLETVNFGENSLLTEIGAQAFADAQRLRSISIPLGVTRIERLTFFNTSVLASISIPSSVTFIGDSAFENSLSLRTVIFGQDSQLTEIDAWAFFNASSLTSISIPAGVNTIGVGAFAGLDLFNLNGRNSLSNVIFLGDAPRNLGADIFAFIASGAKAYVPVDATRFPANGQDWNGLIVSRDTPPSDEDSDDSPPSGGGSDSPTFTPSVSTSSVATKSVDASFKLTNRKYLSKFEIRKAITKDRSFKRKPVAIYKYSISKASKKNCLMRGNYVMRLKEKGVCEITVTRSIKNGIKSKYQVKINYNN